MDELDEIRRRKLQELKEKIERARVEEEQRIRAEMTKREILRRILTPEARSRLTNIKLSRPQFAEQLELQLIQLAQAGRITKPISEEELLRILKRLLGKKKETKIRWI
ncbi:MAG TPA: DNA-binding protein [Euryarchaeota archaeon]|nr:MAG: DNA-binding protein [Thermococci archaeon]RLF97277.1 MAG: DNA-binding protein [Thermococci archaeon]HDI10222.1 DNA-binding protein [Euryarchaeota archaeon]